MLLHVWVTISFFVNLSLPINLNFCDKWYQSRDPKFVVSIISLQVKENFTMLKYNLNKREVLNIT